MEADTHECFFKFKYNCNNTSTLIQNNGEARLRTIIAASKAYHQDNIALQIEEMLSTNTTVTIFYHKNCVTKYSSKTNLKHLITPISEPEPPKRLRYSLSKFDFVKHCLFCGEECILDKDPKHPERWKPAYLCRSTASTSKQGDESISYKQNIIDR